MREAAPCTVQSNIHRSIHQKLSTGWESENIGPRDMDGPKRTTQKKGTYGILLSEVLCNVDGH